MAAKIRYLQDFKLDRDQMQISLFKHRHVLDKLKKENSTLREDNAKKQENIDNMKLVMLEFDHQRLNDLQCDDYDLETLVRENEHLRRLLMIHENQGVLEGEIESGIKDLERLIQEGHSNKTSPKKSASKN